MKKRGRGISLIHHTTGLTGGGDPSQAIVRIKPDGSADLLIGTVDHGQGAKTVFAQMAAEELGLPYESINVINSDTDTSPICTGSFASRATYMTGKAVKEAAANARQVLLEVATEELGAPTDQLEASDGHVFVKAYPEQSIPISDLATKATWNVGKFLVGTGSFMKAPDLPDPETGAGEPYDAYEYATCIADVEVDTETGEVEVQKLVMAFDVGKAINPVLVEGQIHGGAAGGIGYGLMEDLTPFYPSVDRQPRNFHDYVIPTAKDMPDVEAIIVEKPCPTGPYGAKGCGEFTANVQSGAIASAIHDAVGIWIDELPITPAKVLKAIWEKQA